MEVKSAQSSNKHFVMSTMRRLASDKVNGYAVLLKIFHLFYATVGFIFNETEELDMCGPLEVFAATKNDEGLKAFDVFTVAETDNPIVCTNGLSVNPTYTIANCPQPDILVIAGSLPRLVFQQV